jgi:hypothetical protein
LQKLQKLDGHVFELRLRKPLKNRSTRDDIKEPTVCISVRETRLKNTPPQFDYPIATRGCRQHFHRIVVFLTQNRDGKHFALI